MTIYQNIERSKQLNDEVEAFLNAGGSVRSLERGYTAYPTGVLPPAKRTHTEAKRAENEKAAAAEKLKVLAKVQQRITKEQQLEEQKTILVGFFERACSKDVRNLVAVSGISPKNLRIAKSGKSVMHRERWVKLKQYVENFVFLPPPEPKQPKPKQPKPKKDQGDEFKRRKLIHQLRAKAEAEGKNTFIAECSKHGWTTYKIYNGSSRCYECRLKSSRTSIDPEADQVKLNRNERADYNREQMKLAMEKGTKDFVGLCKNCGYSNFRAHKVSKRDKFEYRCMPCQNSSHAKHNRKRNEKA